MSRPAIGSLRNAAAWRRALATRALAIAVLAGCTSELGAGVDAPPGDAVTDAALDPCRFRSVAYGYDGTGAGSAEGRRSAGMCLAQVRSDGRILVSSPSAANCQGDGGGPLFIEGSLKVVGVLDSAYCVPGMQSMFVSVDNSRSFIETALKNN